MEATFFIKTFAALFAIMAPLANMPVFLSMTEGRTQADRRNIAVTACATVATGAVVVILSGDLILGLFGLTVNDFKLAGGLLVLLIAINMVNGSKSESHSGTKEEKKEISHRENIGVYPLGLPILLGPGTISTLIVFRGEADTAREMVALIIATLLNVGILLALFLAGAFASRFVGASAIAIMGRIMGMVLAAIAMEMIVSALGQLLPGLLTVATVAAS